MTHTWDLYLHYHRCPECGFILESRERPVYRNGQLEKPLDCPRCQNHWMEKRPYNGPIAPLFGSLTSPEFTWE